MDGTNVQALNRAHADGSITEEEYLLRLPDATEADDENARIEHAAEAQRNAREHGAINRRPSPKPTAGHPNDGVVSIVTEATTMEVPAGTALVDLNTLAMLKGSTGKVSGYARVLVGGRSAGAFMLFAPADMADVDKVQSVEARKLRDLAESQLRAGAFEQAKTYLEQADAAQKRYDTARQAAKADWTGKRGTDVINFVQAR